MKFALSTTLALLLSAITFFAKAQYGPEFPELKVKEDYARAEPMFLQVTEWITETPLDEQEELRAYSNAFLIQWINGSPTVFINLGKQLGKLIEHNHQLLPIYMANYAAFCIRNKQYNDPSAATRAGLQAMVKVYRRGRGIKNVKILDKLANAADKNGLDEYISKYMKQETDVTPGH